MSLQVVSSVAEGMKAKIILEGGSYSDVSSNDAKQTAIAEGQKLLGLCGISLISGPYPIGEDGKEIDDPRKFAEVASSKKALRYRNDFTIQQSLAL